MRDVAPTKTAYLELLEERQGMQEGYRFLDEKRMVLAAEIVRELEHYRQYRTRFEERYAQALNALREAISRHGLQGLSVYPPLCLNDPLIEREQRILLGVNLATTRLQVGRYASVPAVNPSPEGSQCQEKFLELLPLLFELASLTGNLSRLQREYRQTSRRARALEDVLLPEIDTTLKELDGSLEEASREEAIRVRIAAATPSRDGTDDQFR